MCIEEMAELTHAITKYLRGVNCVSYVEEEIADVEIMLEQLKFIIGNRQSIELNKTIKLIRLEERLKNAHPKN